MAQHVGEINAAALIGVGAAFDFLSGEKPRAAVARRVAFSLDHRAAAARPSLSRLQFDFHSARFSAARGIEILRAGLVSASRIRCTAAVFWARAYETFDFGLRVRTQPWF
jgi:hypothetical protein